MEELLEQALKTFEFLGLCLVIDEEQVKRLGSYLTYLFHLKRSTNNLQGNEEQNLNLLNTLKSIVFRLTIYDE
jgi:hypothetical protein